MIELIFDLVYGLKGDFCLAVFLIGAFLLGIGLAGSHPPVDTNQDNGITSTTSGQTTNPGGDNDHRQHG